MRNKLKKRLGYFFRGGRMIMSYVFGMFFENCIGKRYWWNIRKH